MADDTQADSVASSASGPKRVSVEGMGGSEEHPLGEQIKAAKFRPSSGLRSLVGGGIKFTKATAGGAVR